MVASACAALRGVAEELEHLPDRPLPTNRVSERQMPLDLVTVASPVLLLQDVTGVGEIGHDPVGSALGDTERSRQVPQTGPWIVGDKQHRPRVVGQEAPLTHISTNIPPTPETHC